MKNIQEKCINMIVQRTQRKSLKFLNRLMMFVIMEELFMQKKFLMFFSKIKPTLIDRRTKKLIDWTNVFKDEFYNYSNDDKDRLVLLVEEYGSIYRLPKEYYK